MEFGLFTEFQCPAGMSETVAFAESMAQMRAAEDLGFDAVRLAGLHTPYSAGREGCPEPPESVVTAGTAARFTHAGRHFHFHDVGGRPKPFQGPHPPLRVAATTEETYPLVGRMGLPLFVAPRTISISDLERFVRGYHEGWTAAGHTGRGDIGLSMPVYVAATERPAREEPEASPMHFFRAITG